MLVVCTHFATTNVLHTISSVRAIRFMLFLSVNLRFRTTSLAFSLCSLDVSLSVFQVNTVCGPTISLVAHDKIDSSESPAPRDF